MFVRWIAGFLLAFLAACTMTQSKRVSYENAPLNNLPTQKIWAELKIPDGNGPFPVVLVLQACGGLDDNVTTDWPKYLNELGYAALIIDILGSRNIQSECGPNTIPLDERMRDIYGAFAFLAHQPNIDARRIYMIGVSWGGTHVLEALLERRLTQFATNPQAAFKGGIAVYPDCNRDTARAFVRRTLTPAFYAPVLIIGAELDDWTPISFCHQIISAQPQPAVARMEVLSGAHHGFDQFTSRGRFLSARGNKGT